MWMYLRLLWSIFSSLTVLPPLRGMKKPGKDVRLAKRISSFLLSSQPCSFMFSLTIKVPAFQASFLNPSGLKNNPSTIIPLVFLNMVQFMCVMHWKWIPFLYYLGTSEKKKSVSEPEIVSWQHLPAWSAIFLCASGVFCHILPCFWILNISLTANFSKERWCHCFGSTNLKTTHKETTTTITKIFNLTTNRSKALA